MAHRTARRRRSALGLASAVAVLGACTSESGSSRDPPATSLPVPTATPTEPEPALLHADMTVLPATGVRVETPSPGRRLLRFGTRLANVGAGPAVVVPAPRVRCPQGQRSFVQRVVRDGNGDGRYDAAADTTAVPHVGACALFHPTHGHWHIDGSARYTLTDPGGAVVVQRRKVSFCLRDTHRVRGAVAARRAYEECSRDAPQGISPGWSDLYDADLDGQAMRLPRTLPDGAYCLVMTADPFDLLRESDETNNASVTEVAIRDSSAVRRSSGACAAVPR